MDNSCEIKITTAEVLHESQYLWKNIKKLALGIIAFEGCEHLYNIISELRDCLDVVIIGMLSVSYHGDAISNIDYNEIKRLMEEDHIVDYILDITTNLEDHARVQETAKRNSIILFALDLGCSHIIVIDSDEYYTKNAFIKGLLEIDEHDYELTYCLYVNYYHDYNHFLKYPFKNGMYVPFVSKTIYRHKFNCLDFKMPSDPTRRFVRPTRTVTRVNPSTGMMESVLEYTIGYHIFEWDEVKMHHLSWIRADIRKKLNMWSSKKLFERYEDLIDLAVHCFNTFDGNMNENLKLMATLLFNTPEHKVEVGKFPKQYIHPLVDISTRMRPAADYKKILFVNMCTDDKNTEDTFKILDECCRRTWAKDIIDGKYPNCEFCTVYGTDKETHWNRNERTIYVQNKGYDTDLAEMTERFINAMDIMPNIDEYDYIIRLNCSTWVNVDIIREFIGYITDESLYFGFNTGMAFWSLFNIYGMGNMLIFSKRNYNIMSKSIKAMKNLGKIINVTGDDILYGSIFYLRCLMLKIPQEKNIISLNGTYLREPFDKTEITEENLLGVGCLFKTFAKPYEIRKIDDVKKCEALLEEWNKIKGNIKLSEVANKIIENMGKTIKLLDLSKNDWINTLTKDKPKIEYKTINVEDFKAVKKDKIYQLGYNQIQLNLADIQ